MKLRLCDFCNGKIEKYYIKCCESKMENKQQKLIHVGDVCMECWDKFNNFRKKEVRRPNLSATNKGKRGV